MSDLGQPQNPSPAGVQAPAQPAPIFRAFTQQQKMSRARRWLLLALPLVAGGGLWALTRARADLLQVPTPRGIYTVRRGMSPQQVKDILGRPLTVEPGADGLTECFRHGVPTLDKPTFRIFSACYEEGELRTVTVKHYEAWDLDAATTSAAPTANAGGPL